MRTPKLGWVITISCFALLTVGAPAGRPQPGPAQKDTEGKRDPGLPAVPVAPTPTIPLPDLPTVPGSPAPPAPSTPPTPATKPAPAPQTVDQLLAELEAVQKQKADLERQEQALKAALQERLKDQQDRLKKVGVVPVPAVPAATRPADGKDMIPPPLLHAK
jgi:hypothetical protein